MPTMSNLIVFFHGLDYNLVMQRMQAFKYELQPDGEQERDMRKFAGSCRFVFNKALALQKENHEAGNKFISYVEMAKQLTEWRNGIETPWLKEAPCHSLQHALKDLERAFKNFFEKRAAFPRFKRKGNGGSFRYPDSQQFKLDQVNSRIFLPKLGWVSYRNSRKVKFSNNWKKAKADVQKVQLRIANARKDFLHKTTTTISKNHALVCIEDLQVKNMSSSAAGTAESPGKKVRQKTGLNRSILDQGWGLFRTQLEYKLEWNGGMLLAVPPHNTSRTCPC
jgi:IS605 OrfB family transposase